jgi:hypothetical protein
MLVEHTTGIRLIVQKDMNTTTQTQDAVNPDGESAKSAKPSANAFGE